MAKGVKDIQAIRKLNNQLGKGKKSVKESSPNQAVMHNSGPLLKEVSRTNKIVL
jgi:hypothetical protein